MMALKALILAFAIGISGCNASMPKAQYIPISEACKQETPEKPNYKYSPPYEKLHDATKDLLGDREASEGYTIKLEAALKACKE